MNVKVNDIFTFNLTLYIVYILNPFIFWNISHAILNLFFIVTTLVFVLLPGKNFEISSNRIVSLIVLITFVIYLFTPLFGHKLNLGRLLKFFPLCLMLFYNKTIFTKTYNNIYKILIVISIFSIIVFLITNVGINLPYIRVNRENRANPYDYYRLYGIVVELYRGNVPISALGINRACGAFTEPGHYGIFLGIFLLAEKLNLKKRSNIILLVAGFFTLSAAFIGLVLISIANNYFSQNKFTIKHIAVITILVFIISFFTFSDSNFASLVRYAVYERHFQDITDITELRTSEIFNVAYQSFLRSSDIFFGYKGVDIDDIVFMQSNYTSFIFIYGFVGIGLSIILLLSLLNRIRMERVYYLSFLIAVLFVLAHRYWMLTEPTIYGLLLITLYKDNVIHINNTKKTN